MLPEVYRKVYRESSKEKEKSKPKLYLTDDLVEYYSKILNDIEIGREKASAMLSDFLDYSLEIPYPRIIYVEELPIIKYNGKLHPILGEENGESIRINKAFYSSTCFPLIIDLDENAVYTLPICYKLNENYASDTISHEFLHHALRERMVNEYIVHKLTKKKI